MTSGYFIAALPVTFLGSMAVRPALGRRSGTIGSLPPRTSSTSACRWPPSAPPCASLGGLALNRLGLALPAEALALGSLASRSVAIAGLVALGLGADFAAVHDLREELAVGLAVKLVAVPAVALAAAFALGLRAPAVPLQLPLPSLMSGAVLSARYGLNPPLASLMPTFGLLPALLSVPAWWWLSHWVLR
jgi:predicted permease